MMRTGMQNVMEEICNNYCVRNPKSGEECKLAMQELWLTGRLLPLGARLVVRHVFRSGETKPMEMVYSFALPRDASLSRFKVTGKSFSVESELKDTQQAVKDYEQGVEEGHLGVMARSYRDGVVNLTLGNILPDEEVVVLLEMVAGVQLQDDGYRFRFPFTLAPTYHAQARTVVNENGMGEMELPEEFGDVILPVWSQDASALHRVGFDLSVEACGDLLEVSSPSHTV
ncbi:MAG TPA: VIT domain-containing protein, partial [bacterium]|nr:VIT domain-containing protein [bacterium]